MAIPEHILVIVGGGGVAVVLRRVPSARVRGRRQRTLYSTYTVEMKGRIMRGGGGCSATHAEAPCSPCTCRRRSWRCRWRRRRRRCCSRSRTCTACRPRR